MKVLYGPYLAGYKGGGRKVICTGDGDLQDEIRGGPSRHADEHGQPGRYLEKSWSTCKRLGIDGGLCLAQQRVLGPEHPDTLSCLAVVEQWSS